MEIVIVKIIDKAIIVVVIAIKTINTDSKVNLSAFIIRIINVTVVMKSHLIIPVKIIMVMADAATKTTIIMIKVIMMTIIIVINWLTCLHCFIIIEVMVIVIDDYY